MTTTQFAGFTDDRARSYDDRVRRHIPGYEMLHKLTELSLASALPDEASLLVVGTGTGIEILEWAPKHPVWRFVGTDTAASMLKLAEEKTTQAGVGDRVRFHVGDVAGLPADPFDAATLMLVLHFVPDDKKVEFLSAIAKRLKPGAPFVIANLVGDICSDEFKTLNAGRKALAIANGLTPQMADEFCDPTRSDMHIISEERLIGALKQAGFSEVRRLCQVLTVGVWVAQRG